MHVGQHALDERQAGFLRAKMRRLPWHHMLDALALKGSCGLEVLDDPVADALEDDSPIRLRIGHFPLPNGHGIELPAAREGTKSRPAAARRTDPRTGRPAAGAPGRPRCGSRSAPMPC